MKRVREVEAILGSQNMELADVDEELDEQIYDLMEEYGANNDLGEALVAQPGNYRRCYQPALIEQT